MSQSLFDAKTRKIFGKIKSATSIPNLIEIQKKSYEDGFMQLSLSKGDRKNKGLQSVLSSLFPVQDPSDKSTLEFVSYDFDDPKYDVDECIQRGISFVCGLRVTLRLTVWDIDEVTEVKEIRGIKEQEVYLGDIPFMTKNGTFIINGTERVIVSQMHRSPGAFFFHDDGKTHSSGKLLYSARIIPYRGSWLDFEFDSKDLLYVRIDRKRKLLVSTLLMSMGMNYQDIFNYYYDTENFTRHDNGWVTIFDDSNIVAHRLDYDLINADTNEMLMENGKKITPRIAKKLSQNGLKNILVKSQKLLHSYIGEDIVDLETGEVLFKLGDQLTEDKISILESSNITSIKILKISSQSDAYIRNTLFADKNKNQDSALIDLFRVLRPGEPATVEASKILFNDLFFSDSKYDLSEVGRIKLNSRLNLDIDPSITSLTKDDIKAIVKVLLNLKDGKGSIDDIDHLGNRRVRSVGELVENQFRIGLSRMEKSILERMSVVDIDTIMPNDLVNSKMLMSVIREFFSTSQLSQFMDQTNPLSEITHKRRLSALGPGGVSRDRVGFEVRDVHPTHYGRICPIETPEGQNIGLINSMATYARVNKYGFIETPYRKVKDGVVTNEVVFLTAIDEGKYKIAQSDLEIDSQGKILTDVVNCRFETGNFLSVPSLEVEFVDVTPMQVVSVGASLIPFLEHNDANRALMGSNMQRQAVPLVNSQAPLVGTGIESVVAHDSGVAVVALNDGVVLEVDAERIVVQHTNVDNSTDSDVDIYNLMKYRKSNHNTCINQRPLVKVGQKINKNTVIADGPAMDHAEIALGRNMLVSFIAWKGYNFEDSILISERIVKDDVFTSVHIEEFEVTARDTRIGPEYITRDMPNVSDEALRNLDEVGIVRIGAQVKSGDILVGKVTPKSESPMTPEEKLLKAIFGEKASDVRDTSLYVPPGVSGTVLDVKILSRRGVEKDQRSIMIEKQQIEKLAKDRDDELKIIDQFVFIRLKNLLEGKTIVSAPKPLKAGSIVTHELLEKLSHSQYWQLSVDDSNAMLEIEEIKNHYDSKRSELIKKFKNKVEKLQGGDDLPQGALKVVKVFIATKHKLQPGDKMAGRHGNKGVISRIMPEEDMPFLEDGTVIDVVMNPLGLPSRMNVGQILETHLGWAAKNLGDNIGKMLDEYSNNEIDIKSIIDFVSKIYDGSEVGDNLKKLTKEEFIDFCKKLKNGVKFATPVFDGAGVEGVKSMLKLAGQDPSGQVKVIDGRTGEYFDRSVTVGYKYILKLHHLVDNKIHARSIGPYSLVTQQPLGGKSHFGGQRFGEMEVWALEAYGAAFMLQELLTVKSDDVVGRIKVYDNIVKGEVNFDSGLPESFNVMIKELRSLCLNVQLEKGV